MKTSRKGVAFIAAREGLATRAYKDAAGVWTIGYGHTGMAGPPRVASGMTVTPRQAAAILAADIERFERRVEKALPAVSQTVFDGAVCFDFNTGAIHKAGWVNAFRQGDLEDARRRLLSWTKAGGRDIAGLKNRRNAEAALIFEGRYEALPPGREDRQADEALLRRLGYEGGDWRETVRRFQRDNPPLKADGIFGRASRATAQRRLEAVKARKAAGGAGALTVAAAGGAHAAGRDWQPLITAAAMFAVMSLIAWMLWRNRARLGRFF